MYSNLVVFALNEEQNKQTCNYWYLVQDSGLAHTAFETKEGVLRWLEERGLSIPGLPVAIQPKDYGKDLINWCKVEGSYTKRMHSSLETFNGLENIVIRSKTLSNGDYVDAYICESTGIRTVHTLNPNIKGRNVYDYWEAAAEMR